MIYICTMSSRVPCFQCDITEVPLYLSALVSNFATVTRNLFAARISETNESALLLVCDVLRGVFRLVDVGIVDSSFVVSGVYCDVAGWGAAG